MLDSSVLFCHDQQTEVAQGGFRLTLLLQNVVHVHGHFIPLSLGLIDHPIVAGCVGDLSSDKCFDDGSHIAGTGLR